MSEPFYNCDYSEGKAHKRNTQGAFMPKLRLSGPLQKRVASFLTLNRIAIGVFARHAMGKRDGAGLGHRF
jgi:hypothetical protein